VLVRLSEVTVCGSLVIDVAQKGRLARLILYNKLAFLCWKSLSGLPLPAILVFGLAEPALGLGMFQN
jgi:hypothetical protein